jgi:biotin--protein ligase
MQEKHIALYTSANASLHELKQALSESFNGVSLVLLDKNTIHEPGALNENTLLFVLPGITDESSPYPSEIGEDGIETIRNYLKNGGVSLGSCAGAYFSCDFTLYNPSWLPQPKTQSTCLRIFNATARGPLAELSVHDPEETWFSDCTVATVSFTDIDNKSHIAEIAYGNGPALFPYSEEEEQSLDVIARYEDVEGRPIAVATKQFGKGMAMFTGVLPFMGFDEQHEQTSQPRLRTLMQQLKPHEASRNALWDRMVSDIKKHHAKFEP